MLKKLIMLLKSINSNMNPGEIAHAVCLGMILGFVPKTNMLWYILTVFFVFMRINRGTFVLFTFLFTLLAPFLDPIFDLFGYRLLTLEQIKPFMTAFIEVPFVGFTKINNSIVCGSLIISLLAYAPVYWLFRLIIKMWRTYLAPAVRKTKLITFLSKLPLIKKIGEIV